MNAIKALNAKHLIKAIVSCQADFRSYTSSLKRSFLGFSGVHPGSNISKRLTKETV
jgi:hypothetical protein